MTAAVARFVMAMVRGCTVASRRDWSAAMQAEFEIAAEDGRPLRFALGCLGAVALGLIREEQGRYSLSVHALAAGVMMPMAVLQIAGSLFGLRYLFASPDGLAGSLRDSDMPERLVRGIYQGAVPAIAMLLLTLGLLHLRLAWSLVDHDWDRVRRLATLMLATGTTLILFVYVLFLDGSQALLQGCVLAIEAAAVGVAAHWHRDVTADTGVPRPG